MTDCQAKWALKYAFNLQHLQLDKLQPEAFVSCEVWREECESEAKL